MVQFLYKWQVGIESAVGETLAVGDKLVVVVEMEEGDDDRHSVPEGPLAWACKVYRTHPLAAALVSQHIVVLDDDDAVVAGVEEVDSAVVDHVYLEVAMMPGWKDAAGTEAAEEEVLAHGNDDEPDDAVSTHAVGADAAEVLVVVVEARDSHGEVDTMLRLLKSTGTGHVPGMAVTAEQHHTAEQHRTAAL